MWYPVPGRAITHDWGEEAVRAWRVAHFGLVVGGIWLMVVAGVSHLLVLTTRSIALLVYSVVTSGYGFCGALVVAAVGGVRGLELAGPALNVIVLARVFRGGVGLVGVGGRNASRDDRRIASSRYVIGQPRAAEPTDPQGAGRFRMKGPR